MLKSTIDAPRLRAARALLNWSIGTLAEKAGVHSNTIKKIENQNSGPTEPTVEKILAVLYRAGVVITDRGAEFLGSVQEYSGQEGFLAFKNDVYTTIKGGGEVFVSNVDERLFVKWAGNEAPHYRELMKSIKNLVFKILIGKGDKHTTAIEYADYREDKSEDFRSDLSTFVYGPKTAFIDFEPDNVVVIIVNNEKLAEVNRDKFQRRWEVATLLK